MIGKTGQKDQALAFTIRKYDDLTDKEKLYVGRFKKNIDTFATEVKEAIKAFKSSQHTLKAALEAEKNNQADKADFRAYLFGEGKFAGNGYIDQLRTIGMSASGLLKDRGVVNAFATLKKAINTDAPLSINLLEGVPVAAVAKKDEKKATLERYFLAAWETATVRGLKNKATGKIEFNIPLLTILTGPDESYVRVADGTRELYEKKSQAEFGGSSQYVKDDDGVFTRRYATMWKGRDVLETLLPAKAGYLKGKFATESGGTLPKVTDPLAHDNAVRKVQKFEAHQLPGKTAGDELTLRQMLHVHQELGSGPSGRGLCLSSISLSQVEAQGGTWKTKVKKSFANNGTSFAGSDNLLVLVDLSKVPTDRDLLYNLYRPEAQERAEAIKTQTNSGTFNDRSHMLNSVSKNRELFLRVLTPDFIVNWTEIETALTT